MRSDPGIFNFVKWLRVGEEACPTLEQAKARLKELYPSKPGWPDTTLVISHSKRMNRALAPEASKLLELETQVIHIDLGETQNGCDKSITQNSPQSMRVWPGLRLMGAGGKIPNVFVAVVEVEPDGVRLDNGMRLKNQELLWATRPSHAVTYASCQGLTLHNRVRLDLESCHLTAPPVRGRLKADKLRAAARRLQGLQHEGAPRRARPTACPSATRAGPPQARSPCGARTLRGAARGCRPGPRRGSAPSPSCTSRACPWRSP